MVGSLNVSPETVSLTFCQLIDSIKGVNEVKLREPHVFV